MALAACAFLPSIKLYQTDYADAHIPKSDFETAQSYKTLNRHHRRHFDLHADQLARIFSTGRGIY